MRTTLKMVSTTFHSCIRLSNSCSWLSKLVRKTFKMVITTFKFVCSAFWQATFGRLYKNVLTSFKVMCIRFKIWSTSFQVMYTKLFQTGAHQNKSPANTHIYIFLTLKGRFKLPPKKSRSFANKLISIYWLQRRKL